MLQIQEFEKEIEKGLPKKLYFCHASEPFFLFELAKLIRKSFNSMAIETIEEPEEVDITSLMNANSLFVEKRILLVYQFEKIKKTGKRIEWLKKIAGTGSASFILLCSVSGKDFAEEIAFLKKEKNCLIFNLDIYERELPEWVTYKAGKHGITLNPDAINYLISITGGQPGLISSEIEKIALLTDKFSIGLFDIKDILSEFGEFTAFDLVDAIKKKDRGKSFRLIDRLQNIEPDMILGALNWYYTNKPEADEKVYSILYKTNLALRQARSCSLEMLVYELLKDYYN